MGALDVEGNTIAVLGNGFNHIYPKENEKLLKKIIEKGLVVTEYSVDEKAQSKYFLERNRIVSGLSLGVLVVEAGNRSGTSVTARYAKQQEREIFCIPHAINDRHGVGTNKLIAQGAKLVTNTKEIIEEFDFLEYHEEIITSLKNKKPIVKKEYKEIFEVIGLKPIEIDEICMKTKKEIQEVNTALLILELEGYVKKIAGGYIWKTK